MISKKGCECNQYDASLCISTCARWCAVGSVRMARNTKTNVSTDMKEPIFRSVLERVGDKWQVLALGGHDIAKAAMFQVVLNNRNTTHVSISRKNRANASVLLEG